MRDWNGYGSRPGHPAYLRGEVVRGSTPLPDRITRRQAQRRRGKGRLFMFVAVLALVVGTMAWGAVIGPPPSVPREAPKAHRGGPSVRLILECTGSMRPAIACTDHVVGYRPAPAPLPVGTIITYPSTACPKLHGRVSEGRAAWRAPGEIVHRIVAVGEARGEVAYEVQGDANSRPDECWIPHSAVRWVAEKR